MTSDFEKKKKSVFERQNYRSEIQHNKSKQTLQLVAFSVTLSYKLN